MNKPLAMNANSSIINLCWRRHMPLSAAFKQHTCRSMEQTSRENGVQTSVASAALVWPPLCCRSKSLMCNALCSSHSQSPGSIGFHCVQGRILILETKPQQHKLQLVHEKETRGAVYTMSGFQVSSSCITLLMCFTTLFPSCRSRFDIITGV